MSAAREEGRRGEAVGGKKCFQSGEQHNVGGTFSGENSEERCAIHRFFRRKRRFREGSRGGVISGEIQFLRLVRIQRSFLSRR